MSSVPSPEAPESAAPSGASRLTDDALNAALRRLGYDGFRSGQQGAIETLLSYSIKESVVDRIFYRNAAGLLGIPA